MIAVLPRRSAFKLGYPAVVLAAALALLLPASAPTRAESVFSFDTSPGKLPKTIIPLHYAIELVPDLQKLTLSGAESIDIEVREPTTRITLNAVNMAVTSAGIDDEAQRADVSLDAAIETATLSFAQPLAAGAHRLRIGFLAKIN